MAEWGSYDTDKNKIQINAEMFEKYEDLKEIDVSKLPFRNKDHLWIFDVMFKVLDRLIGLLKGTNYVVSVFDKDQKKAYIKLYGSKNMKESLGFSDEELDENLHDKFYEDVVKTVYSKEVEK